MAAYESPYCTFRVPDDWEPQPPFGFMEPGGDEDGLSAQVVERWLDKPMPVATHAAEQKEILPAILDEVEFLGEGPYPVQGPGQAHYLDLRYRTDDGDPAVEKRLYLTLGPFLGQLTLFRLAQTDARSQELLEAIGRTFTLRQTAFLQRYQPFGLFAEPELPRPEEWPRQKFPRCCSSLPLPPGWEVREEDGMAVLRKGAAEIRLRRLIGEAEDADTWLSENMERLQRTQSFLVGSDRGELDDGTPYAALFCDEQGATRRWQTAAVQRALLIFLEGQQPLECTLRGTESAVHTSRPALQALVRGLQFLDPKEWQLKLAEPWVDVLLEGPWITGGPGVYANVEEGALIHLSVVESRAPLEELRPSIVDSIRQGVGEKGEVEESEERGTWRGMEAFRYGVDRPSGKDGPISVRSLWAVGPGKLYACFVRCPETTICLSLLHRLVGDRLSVSS